MKIYDDQKDLYLGGVHYIRKNANEPWDFAPEHITKKYDLDGNVTYCEILGRVIMDNTPNKTNS